MSGEGRTLTYSELHRMARPMDFSTMVKPVGSSCNMRCAYCYYLDKASLYDGQQPVMSDSLLELYIREYIEAVDADTVTFCWHGGEPLLAGLPFFERAMQLQQRYRNGKEIHNTLQTNGLLVDEYWCQFFHEHRFLVGLSLDGPAELHDVYRCDRGGHPTQIRVLRAAEKMIQANVDFNILCTVNAHSEKQGTQVYNYLREISPFLQFLPVVEYTDGMGHIVPPGTPGAYPTPYSVGGEGFGQFLCDVYDTWVHGDVGRIYVQLFDNTLAGWCGIPSTLCTLCETCGDTLTVEHNGDVYLCDHYVYTSHLLGNISRTPLAELARHPQRFAFASAKCTELSPTCRRCQWLHLCHGECPQHRFADKGLNTLCEGYKRFFTHTASDMQTMKSLLERGLPPSRINRG